MCRVCVCVSGHSVAGVTLPGPLSLLSAQSTIIHNNYQPSFYQQCQQKSTIKSNFQLSLCLQYHQAHPPCHCHTEDDDEPTIKTSWFDLELRTVLTNKTSDLKNDASLQMYFQCSACSSFPSSRLFLFFFVRLHRSSRQMTLIENDVP